MFHCAQHDVPGLGAAVIVSPTSAFPLSPESGVREMRQYAERMLSFANSAHVRAGRLAGAGFQAVAAVKRDSRTAASGEHHILAAHLAVTQLEAEAMKAALIAREVAQAARAREAGDSAATLGALLRARAAHDGQQVIPMGAAPTPSMAKRMRRGQKVGGFGSALGAFNDAGDDAVEAAVGPLVDEVVKTMCDGVEGFWATAACKGASLLGRSYFINNLDHGALPSGTRSRVIVELYKAQYGGRDPGGVVMASGQTALAALVATSYVSAKTLRNIMADPLYGPNNAALPQKLTLEQVAQAYREAVGCSNPSARPGSSVGRVAEWHWAVQQPSASAMTYAALVNTIRANPDDVGGKLCPGAAGGGSGGGTITTPSFQTAASSNTGLIIGVVAAALALAVALGSRRSA